jgi:thioredoxin-related protein
MRTGRNPHQYQFLTEKELDALNTSRLLNVLKVARAMHVNLVDKGLCQDPLYMSFQKYIEVIKYILSGREHVQSR